MKKSKIKNYSQRGLNPESLDHHADALPTHDKIPGYYLSGNRYIPFQVIMENLLLFLPSFFLNGLYKVKLY